jgi:hypothetical protein
MVRGTSPNLNVRTRRLSLLSKGSTFIGSVSIKKSGAAKTLPPAKYTGIHPASAGPSSQLSDQDLTVDSDRESSVSEGNSILSHGAADTYSQTSLESPTQPPVIEKQASPTAEQTPLEDLRAQEKDSINVWGLCKIASAKRKGCHCVCDRESIHIGSSFLVAFVDFDDGVTWVARMPLQSSFSISLDHSVFREHMASMVATMEFVAQRTTVPVSAIHAWDSSCDNLLCRPYIFMEYVRGDNLVNHINSFDDVTLRKVILQWADYSMQLSSLRFNKIGSLQRDAQGDITVQRLLAHYNILADDSRSYINGPFHSTADYLLYGSVAKRLNESKLNRPSIYPNLRPLSTLIDTILPFMLESELINGPFVLHHPNLGVNNILIDPQNGEITSVLGWEWAAVLPLQSHIIVPEELNYEFLPRAEIEQLPGGSARHGWKIDFSQRFRSVYEDGLVASARRLSLNYAIEDILDRSLMYTMYEKAAFSIAGERYFVALWEHIFGTEVSYHTALTRMRYEGRHAKAKSRPLRYILSDSHLSLKD